MQDRDSDAHHPRHALNGHCQPHTNGALAGCSPAPSARPPVRVAAVIPGYNRREDLEKLFKDMSRLDLRGIELWCVLVDNNSPTPLDTIKVPDNVLVEHYRLPDNRGGAGGFSAGMARVLAGHGLSARFDQPDFLWLVDSDARVAPGCLRELVRVMLKRPDACAAGSALVDPLTRTTYEIGGRVNPKNGFFIPAARGDVDHRRIVPAQYLAACSALVRREAVEKTGLMPEIFIHGDDVEWFLQMTRATGQKVVGAPRSIAGHPLWNRKFQTWVRYYVSRNAYAPIDVMGFGAKTRFLRALVDVLRALGQTITGMDELAELHLRGLEDAAANKTVGHQVPGGMGPIIQATKVRPMAELAPFIKEELAKAGAGATLWVHPILFLRSKDLPGSGAQYKALGVTRPRDWRYWNRRSLGSHIKSDLFKAVFRVFAPKAAIAVVPTGQPSGWFRGRTLVLMTADGFLVRRVETMDRVRVGLKTTLRGLKAAVALARRPRTYHKLPPAPPRSAATFAEVKAPIARPAALGAAG
ncbi:MAG TPA: glycosyltransferase family 2 protein [Phycisphaerales bacterium]|nr:glycosyltransferase family 2 protein [Phycisphaerales bacterium]